MKPQALVPVSPTATVEHCAFAVQSIRKLSAAGKKDFGDQWPWFELLMRPRKLHWDRAGGTIESFIDRLYTERPTYLSDGEVLERAIHWLMRRNVPTRVSVNTHPMSLTSIRFCDLAIQGQLQVQTCGHSICLELVEFGDYPDRQTLVDNARSLRSMGLVIALDDFGSRVNVFDLCAAGIVDVLKIDLSIVRELHRDLYQRAVVDSISRLGCGIGAQVVAEGVETEAELTSLEALGIDFAQGFHFHRPEPSEI